MSHATDAALPHTTLILNGNPVTVTTGVTLMEAARTAGIEIPHLCHLPGKEDSPRPCLLCLVEVNGEQRRACRTLVEEGMEVVTESAALTKYRQQRLTELASHHYGDCKAPCTLTCPGGINVQGYINLIARGEHEAALRLIKEQNALPGIVCRVCPRFCETRCRRVLIDEPIAINHLKRFAVDWAKSHGGLQETPGDATGHKAAIIGGGPAGLSCAYYLRKLGHDVTLFEADEKLGGMARYGIPNFKMPNADLDLEIENIINLGLHVRTGMQWGRDFTLASLQDKGFETIFIATGLANQKQLEIPGREFVMDGLGFLRRVNNGDKVTIGNKVIFIGGNKIAVEAARTARRLGAHDVTVLYPRAKVEMPAPQRDIEEAEKEGVQFFMMATALSLAKTERGTLRMELARTVLSEPDAKGMRFPIPMEGSLLFWEGDTVINGEGQQGEAWFAGFGELEGTLVLTPGKTIKSSPSDMATNIAGIYAGGEAASGARSVIQAVDSARRAAEAMHQQMSGSPMEKPADGRFNFLKGKKFEDVDMKNFTGWNIALRETMPARPPERRVADFDEVESGYSSEMAIREAKRCIQCGCAGLAKCTYRPLCQDNKVQAKNAPSRLINLHKTDHPSIIIDADKCVLCHRCVRSCQYEAISVTFSEENGTVRAKDVSFNDKCVSCGACVDSCPTGTLSKKTLLLPILPAEATVTNSVCTYCGTGCRTEIHTKHNAIVEIKGDPAGAANHGELCVKGRFGYDFYRQADRLTQPLLRHDIQEPFRKVSWDEALDYIAEKFPHYRGSQFAALASARCSNEENYLLQKFTRQVMGTNSIDHCARL